MHNFLPQGDDLEQKLSYWPRALILGSVPGGIFKAIFKKVNISLTVFEMELILATSTYQFFRR